MFQWLWKNIFGGQEETPAPETAIPSVGSPSSKKELNGSAKKRSQVHDSSAKKKARKTTTELLETKTKFEPKKSKTSWTTSYNRVLKIYNKNGNIKAITAGGANPELKKWVKQQSEIRKLAVYCPTLLTNDQKAKLGVVGIKPSPSTGKNDRRFLEMFQKLQSYREKHGDCKGVYKEDKELGKWCRGIRRKYRMKNQGKGTSLTDVHIQALNEIGFEWIGQAGRPTGVKK